MLTLTDDELKSIIVAAVRQIDAAGQSLRDDYSIRVGMPVDLQISADVFLDTAGSLITTNVSSSVQAASTDVQSRVENSTATDNGESTSEGNSRTERSGGNVQVTEDDYQEY